MAERAVTAQAAHEPPASRAAPRNLLLQRKCACGASAGGAGECETCAAKQTLQRHSHGEAQPLLGTPSSVSDTLARPGRPLDADTRSFMEERFGSDFADVRVHDDSAAAASARDVDAHAYTVGQNIVFADGQYQPHSDGGRHLLAHELAHTVQQQGLQRAGVSNLADQGPDYQRMEREADFAAERVMAGEPLAGNGLSRSGPSLQRSATTPVPATTETKGYRKKNPAKTISLTIESAANLLTFKKVTGNTASYEFDVLRIPPEKGGQAKPFYADAKKLKVKFQGPQSKPTPLGNVERDATEKLRRTWLAERKRELASADSEWQAAGGAAAFPQLKTESSPCEVDHIQELQVGGTNDGKNLQLLTKNNNGASGNLLSQQLVSMAAAALEDAQSRATPEPDVVELSFARTELAGAPKPDACLAVGQAFDQATPLAKAVVPTADFALTLGGRNVTLKLPVDNSKEVDLEASAVAENSQFAWGVKGIVFERVGRTNGKVPDKLFFRLDTVALNLSSKAHGGSKSKQFVAVDKTGNADLAKAGKLGVPFDFSKLSPGKLTSLEVGPQGLIATGTLKPSLPFLPTLDVAVDGPSFKVTKNIDPAKMKPPFPGLNFTKAELALELAPEFKPVGTLAFDIGPAAKPVAKGVVKASADASGLKLDGDLWVFLPGVDEAKGEVRYQGGEWSASAHIESGQMAGKIPYLKSGAVDVNVQKGKLGASGTLDLALPGENEGQIKLSYAQNKWIFTGRGKIKVKSPYLKPIEAKLYYDGDLFKAEGKAGFAFSGLDGTLDATYENRAGKEKIYGTGDIKIEKGKAKGNILVTLHPNEKITGKGKLSYEIKKDLVASAGITVDENQKITFDGELSFPDIQLFKRFPEKQEEHTLFKASGSIPIPGASIGPVGLKVKLWGSLGYFYYVGPGVLTGVKATVKFSPFEPDPDFSFNLKAKASIPAGGGISGKLGADLAIDALIAEVGGGLNVTLGAKLNGKAELGAEIAYSKDKFAVDAEAYVGGSLELEAVLRARIYAEAGFSVFSVRTEKSWDLLGGTFPTGLNLGVRMPLHYDSVDGFRMPKLADIKPEPASLSLDPSKMLGSLFSQTQPKEREA